MIHQYIDGYKLINWKLIKNENNLGYRKNFKKGLEIVDGDIIFLSDQDDRWHLNKIEVMVEKMRQSNILSLASSFNFMDQDGNCFEVNKIKGRSNNNLLFKEVTEELTEIDLKSLLEMNFSQGCCMAIKKEVKDEYLKVTQGKLPHDWELNIISAIQNGCYYLDIPLIDYRIHNNNISKGCSSDFIIQNLDEKYKIYNLARNMSNFRDKITENWLNEQMFLTLDYYISESPTNFKDYMKIIKWINKNIKHKRYLQINNVIKRSIKKYISR